METINNEKTVKLPWVPTLGSKLQKEFKKFGIKTTSNLVESKKVEMHEQIQDTTK